MKFLSIADYDRIQHFRHSAYYKLWADRVLDPGLRSLPSATRWQYIALYRLAVRFNDRVPFKPDWLRQELGLLANEKLDIASLVRVGLVTLLKGNVNGDNDLKAVPVIREGLTRDQLKAHYAKSKN